MIGEGDVFEQRAGEGVVECIGGWDSKQQPQSVIDLGVAAVVADFVARAKARNPALLYACDPVLGDRDRGRGRGGRRYP